MTRINKECLQKARRRKLRRRQLLKLRQQRLSRAAFWADKLEAGIVLGCLLATLGVLIASPTLASLALVPVVVAIAAFHEYRGLRIGWFYLKAYRQAQPWLRPENQT